MTDEELASLKIAPCRACDSTATSVRPQGNNWYYVGCTECFNKTLCDKANVEYAIELWERRNGKRRK